MLLQNIDPIKRHFNGVWYIESDVEQKRVNSYSLYLKKPGSDFCLLVMTKPQTKLKNIHLVVSIILIFVSILFHMHSSTSHDRELCAQQKIYLNCPTFPLTRNGV